MRKLNEFIHSDHWSQAHPVIAFSQAMAIPSATGISEG